MHSCRCHSPQLIRYENFDPLARWRQESLSKAGVFPSLRGSTGVRPPGLATSRSQRSLQGPKAAVAAPAAEGGPGPVGGSGGQGAERRGGGDWLRRPGSVPSALRISTLSVLPFGVRPRTMGTSQTKKKKTLEAVQLITIVCISCA